MKKLTRLDGTHHHCRLGDRTIAFQPFLGDPQDSRCHNVLDDETAKRVLVTEKGQYEVENLPNWTEPEVVKVEAAAEPKKRVVATKVEAAAEKAEV